VEELREDIAIHPLCDGAAALSGGAGGSGAAAVSSLTLGASANSRGSRATLQMEIPFTSESWRNFVRT
jgi:hypothetical protein